MFFRKRCNKLICEFKISYSDGDFGKTIIFKDNKLKYRNTISPTIASQKFPDGYFDERETNLLFEDVENISTFLKSSKPELWKSDIEFQIYFGGPAPDLFYCVFSDNTTINYKAKSKHNEEFLNFANYLERYCSFPAFETDSFKEDDSYSYKIQKDNRACICNKCKSLILHSANFCPVCGEKNVGGKIVNEKLDNYFDETLMFCPNCRCGNLWTHNYCYSCGVDLHQSKK